MPVKPRKPGKPNATTWRKGDPNIPRQGRKPGSLNKVPVAVKEFLKNLVEDPDVQESIRLQIVAGGRDAIRGFLGATAHVIGHPKETVEVNTPQLSGLLEMALAQSMNRQHAHGHASTKGGRPDEVEEPRSPRLLVAGGRAAGAGGG